MWSSEKWLRLLLEEKGRRDEKVYNIPGGHVRVSSGVCRWFQKMRIHSFLGLTVNGGEGWTILHAPAHARTFHRPSPLGSPRLGSRSAHSPFLPTGSPHPLRHSTVVGASHPLYLGSNIHGCFTCVTSWLFIPGKLSDMTLHSKISANAREMGEKTS